MMACCCVREMADMKRPAPNDVHQGTAGRPLAAAFGGAYEYGFVNAKPFAIFVNMWRFLILFVFVLCGFAEPAHPILALGSTAPDFSLPGVDGKVHKLSDYASSPVMVIVFTCNHCPIASIYEDRIQKLADDYQARGVAVVAIQPNDPEA